MPDGQEMLIDAQMKHEIKRMKDEGTLDEWTAEQVYLQSKKCAACLGNSFSKKQSGIAIGVSSAILMIWSVITGKFNW